MYINVPGQDVLVIIVIRENCTVHKSSWEISQCPACHAACNKRELYTVHKRYWEGCIGYNRNKRELYLNVSGKDVLAIIVIREICT